jgi:ribosomal protein S18 acetylase RimI-like enzyme
MSAICLHDKATIERALRQNTLLHLYALGDLDAFFWNQTTWFGWQSRKDAIDCIILLFSGLELPCLLVIGNDQQMPALRTLLTSIQKLLPPRFYAHLSPSVEEALGPPFEIDSHGQHLKMGLANPSRLDAVDTSDVIALTEADRDEILALYKASYPETWFELHMLRTGLYFGLRDGGKLVSIAGVHVHSPTYRVAALGNITTHPHHRGRGFAARTIAALCRRLLETCDHVGLNVKADNTAAIHCYEKLGFEPLATYEEALVTRRLP